MAKQCPDLAAVFACVGGVGLIGGIGICLKARLPDVESVGCYAENAPAMYECLKKGEIFYVPERATLSDGSAGSVEKGAITFPICQQVIDRYKLFFLGMSQAISVKVEADYKRIYSHLETELGVQAQIQAVSIAADVGAAFQRLRETSIIKVEITEFTDDADLRSKGEAAWEWFKNQLTQDFFSTAMSPPSFMLPSSGGGMLGQLQNLFGAMPGRGAPGSLQPSRGAAATSAPSTGVPVANLSDGFATTSSTNAMQSAARAPAGGGAGGGNAISEFSPFRIGLSLKTFQQDELKIRRFDYTLQAAILQEANPNGMFSAIVDGYNLDKHIFIVDMDDPFFDRIISTVTMGQNLAALGIASVAVNMEYPADRPANRDADHIDGFLFRPDDTDSRSFTTFVNDRNDRDYRYKMTITFDPTTQWRGQDSQIETDWITTADKQLPLAPMDEIELLDVEIGLSNLQNDLISQVEVDVEYVNPDTGFSDKRMFSLTPGGPPQRWQLRLADDAPLQYKYRVRYFFAEGNLQIETPFETSERPSIMINPPFKGRQRMTINPLLLDASNLLQAIVDIEYEEPDTGYMVTYREEFDGMDPLSNRRFIIPTLRADPLPVTYHTTIIKNDGTVISKNDQTTDSGIILLSEGVGTIQRVRLRLPTQSLGEHIALKVELVGSGDTADETSALFTPSQLDDKMVSLVQPDGATREYDFTVTGYSTLGVGQVLASGSSNDASFIVPMS